jgi:hypothetical protein
MRLVSFDLTDELELSSRLLLRSHEKDPKDLEDGASDLRDALLGLGGWGPSCENWASEIAAEACSVKPFCDFPSEFGNS